MTLWGVAKGSSVSWVAKFKGDEKSECKLSNAGHRLRGGQNVSREFGGGKTYCRVCSAKPVLEASEIGVGLVGASFF